jgi:predicted alpha/beta hydrolase family esterase
MRYTNCDEPQVGNPLAPFVAKPVASTADAGTPWYQQPRTAKSFLIVPGLGNSGPAHWQTHWHTMLPGARRVVQRNWDLPVMRAWADTVARAILAMDRPIVVAHSFGCAATLLATQTGATIRGALLVAPADLQRSGVAGDLPRYRLPFPSTLVASTNDPWLKLVTAGELASVWGSRFVALRDAGHINAEAGYGPWADGLQLLRELARCSEQTRVSPQAN